MCKYSKLGESKIKDGEILIKPSYLDGSCYYWDKEAYVNDWDKVCYVPEHGFYEWTIDEDGFYQRYIGFTHNELLDLCYGNREMCDALFYHGCSWQYPKTYLDDWDNEDIAEYYKFIKPGTKVWWNDPAGETSGEYTVYKSPFEINENGEFADPSEFDLDAIVLIGNGVSEVEVPSYELTPIYNCNNEKI